MLPNSFSFLAFFALVAIAYWALPHRFRWPLLLVASGWFYSTFELEYLVLLVAVTGVTYFAGRAIEGASEPRRRKRIFSGSAVAVVCALLFFKYANFLLDSVNAVAAVGGTSLFPTFPRLDLVLFVGLSFYTFSCLSYLTDVYRGDIPAERHAGHFALYVAYFPKLLAGPIERARPFLDQIRAPAAFSAATSTFGLQLLLWGLFKKVVIADNLATFVDAAYSQPAFASPADLLLGTYFFAFQLYCDFSGYSDMAIGMSAVLGIRLMENFRRPYFSRSVPEFWAKRWHLSLAGWFRDYLYIPLGGSRVPILRRALNVMVVFLVSGLWHGAAWTFVVWGGLNGFYQVVSMYTRGLRERLAAAVRIPDAVLRVFQMLLTFHLVLFSWVFFRAATVGDAVLVLQRTAESAGAMFGMLRTRLMTGDVVFALVLIVFLLAAEALEERKPAGVRMKTFPAPLRWSLYYGLIVALAVVGAWRMNSFVYMQF